MPSPFDALWAGLQPTFDGALGEPILIEPKAPGSGRRIVAAAADPSLAPFAVVGIFRAAVMVDRAPTPRAGQSDGPDVMVGKITADFAVSQFTAATMPREGWTLVLPSRPGAPRYVIGAVKPDSVARIVCVLADQGNSA